mmetsp:Transcript_67435/g.140913  ORF Transcript_67435/g.140913 Transcript_67435/m.140913 type:complete len:89 (-) Transcript_67435:661-927(-)
MLLDMLLVLQTIVMLWAQRALVEAVMVVPMLLLVLHERHKTREQLLRAYPCIPIPGATDFGRPPWQFGNRRNFPTSELESLGKVHAGP